jgi:hypothetical protein
MFFAVDPITRKSVFFILGFTQLGCPRA